GARWSPTPHRISRHVAAGGSCDTQRAHTRLTRWRPYRKGESKMLSPRYSARNPSAVSSWTSMALRRDHFSSEFISTGIDRLPLPCCSINRRSELGNPSPGSSRAKRVLAERSKFLVSTLMEIGGSHGPRPKVQCCKSRLHA